MPQRVESIDDAVLDIESADSAVRSISKIAHRYIGRGILGPSQRRAFIPKPVDPLNLYEESFMLHIDRLLQLAVKHKDTAFAHTYVKRIDYVLKNALTEAQYEQYWQKEIQERKINIPLTPYQSNEPLKFAPTG